MIILSAYVTFGIVQPLAFGKVTDEMLNVLHEFPHYHYQWMVGAIACVSLMLIQSKKGM